MPAAPFNPLASGYKWSFKDHLFTGYSVAGITTSLVYDHASAVFDIGQGLPFNIPRHHYFLTHPHSDHSGGLAYMLSQRSMWSLPPAHVYVLPQFVEPLTKIVNAWHELEDFKYEFFIHPMATDTRVELPKGYVIESFKTHHRVASQGYTLIKAKKKLKPEFVRLPQSQLIELKKKKTVIEDVVEERIFSFTGDTTIEVLDHLTEPVKVLFIEATFIDDLKDVASARKWGHTHLDEIIERLPSVKAEKIVLIHLSARYSTKFANGVLDAKVPTEYRHKIEFFPRPL